MSAAYICGIAAFLLFFISEPCEVKGHTALSRFLFGAGAFSLFASVVWLCIHSLRRDGPRPAWLTAVAGVLSLGFLVLLVYTLFFALPFQNTYIGPETGRPVCDSGIYALCRHPGVWWLAGLLLSLWGAARLPLGAALLFSVLNFLYVLFQDRWSFPKLLAGYDAYRASTPFLLPTAQSIRRCRATWPRVPGRS